MAEREADTVSISKLGSRKDRGSGNDVALVVILDGEQFGLTYANLASLNLNTAEKIVARVEDWATTNGYTLPPFWVHINADGSLALAIGEEPAVWPEDEV